MTPYETIERLLDRFGVADVLIMIGDISAFKAEHVARNWQDAQLAKEWMKTERVVKRAVRSLPKAPGIK